MTNEIEAESATTRQALKTCEGILERFTFYNEENGYAIARLRLTNGASCTVVGHMAGVNAGESLRVRGQWVHHPQYGRQFRIESYETLLPTTEEGLCNYLGSGLIKGIGPVTAKRIVRRFGLNTLRILDEEPNRLHEALGVGPKRAAMIKTAWEEQKKVKDLMLFLQTYGVSVGLAVKIYKHYGDAALDVVRNDPYRMAREVYGIGFITADRIARQLGLPSDAPQRVQAGVTYVLGKLAGEGHVFSPETQLVEKASEMLEVEAGLVNQAVQALETEDILQSERVSYQGSCWRGQTTSETREEKAVYLAPFYYSEVSVAGRIIALAEHARRAVPYSTQDDWDNLFSAVESEAGVSLNQAQQKAIMTALTNKVTVLTGGPGTGKTTTIRSVLNLLRRRGCACVLTAPTGRAAKRLSELTGQEAKTIHRLLEYSPRPGNRFQRHEERPLEADMVIVDEASMLDLLLTHHLLKAIPLSAHLLLVGDIDQLPSVGAGNVLRDVIQSSQVPVIRLETIFRQEETSWIVENAHRINHGQMPVFSKDSQDFYLFPTEDAQRAADLVIELLEWRMPRRFGVDPRRDIQVLCPMHRGLAGVSQLNERLQAALNPSASSESERRSGECTFRIGDRVMQVRNNYDKDVFNGDIGFIRSINLEDQIVRVIIDDRPVDYDFSELDDLTLAYAISVHKSQGSEYPAVVVPLLPQHYMMLQRNLLYTAITRARYLVVIVGSRRAIRMAVRNNRVTSRYTALAERIMGVRAGSEQ